jgi:hypothetical protein
VNASFQRLRGSLLSLTVLLAACNDDASGTGGGGSSSGGGGAGPGGAGAAGQGQGAATSSAGGGGAAAVLPSYVVPIEESTTAITLDRGTGEFFVDSAESGKIWTGVAGAEVETELELWADLSEDGITRGGHLALTPDGETMVMVSGLGATPTFWVIDRVSRALVESIEVTIEGGVFASFQDVAISADGSRAFATNSFENRIYELNLTALEVSSFAILGEFPFINDPAQGFINATGIAATSDGESLLVVHIIDKHVYRVSLTADSLGESTQVDTAPYNISGNGLWLDANGGLIEVAGDELRVFRFQLDDANAVGSFEAKYQSDQFEAGLSYAVSYGDRLLVLNGNGVGLGAGPGGGGGGFPMGGAPAQGGGFPGAGGFPGGPTGEEVLPIRVLQLPL